MLPARLPTGSILLPKLGTYSKLKADPLNHGIADLRPCLQAPARKPKQTKLNRKAEPGGVAPPLPDQGKVCLAKRIVTGKLLIRLGRLKEAGPLSRGKETAPWHFSL